MTRRTVAAGTLADLRALLAQANTLADTLRAALSAAESEPAPTAPPWKFYSDRARWMRSIDDEPFNTVAIAWPDGQWMTYDPETIWDDDGKEATMAHAMAAADKALATHMAVTDPAPEPPDLSGVGEFGPWFSVIGAAHSARRAPGADCLLAADGLTVAGRFFPAITTREAADAFLRACGATLAEAPDVICEQCSARTAQVKRGACPEIECPHGLSIAGAKRARWSGLDLLGRTALGVERIGLVRPSYGSGLWLAIYRGKTAALPDDEKAARAAVEAAARADGWEIV